MLFITITACAYFLYLVVPDVIDEMAYRGEIKRRIKAQKTDFNNRLKPHNK